MKPMLKYRGGKSRELSEIKKYIPSFEGRYIEPFFGGGALFFDLEPQNAIINDINISLMDFYRGIRNDFLDVKSELKKIQVEYEKNREEFDFLKKTTLKKHVDDKNEAIYYKMRDIFNGNTKSDLQVATVYYALSKSALLDLINKA